MGFNGGVFATSDQSKIIITYSVMFNNLGIIDAVFKAYDLGAIEIHHSSITHNRAISTPIGEVFYSKMQSIISNTTINNNIRINNQEYLDSVEGLDLLAQFNEFVEINKEEFSKGQLLWSIRVIFSDLIFENCTETPIEQGTLLFYAGNSVAIIRNCIFRNISFTVSIFIFSGSEATLQNLIFRNNTLISHFLPFIYCTSSVVKGRNLVFEDSILNDIATDFSVIQLTNVTYRNITSQFKSLLTFQRGTSQETDSEGNIVKSTLNDITFKDIVVNGDNLIHWHGSKFDSVVNLVVQNVSGLTMDLFDSDINLFNDVQISQTLECIKMKDSKIYNASQLLFDGCGVQTTKAGGAIYVGNSDIHIYDSQFLNGMADVGGAINVDCSFDAQCDVTVSDSKFENNSAIDKGGAIYYNLNRPAQNNLTFTNNSAVYGPNIASYPLKIVRRGTTNNKIKLNNVPSGLFIPEPLEFDIIDYDGQLVHQSNHDIVKVVPISDYAYVSGYDFSTIVNGSVNFTHLNFRSSTGAQNVVYQLSSHQIDTKTITKVFNDSAEDFNNHLIVSFRYCKPGERITANDQCEACSIGLYSFRWNSTECKKCFDNARCEGGSEVKVSKGYWRYNLNSSMIIE